ncbi:MAG TPA: ribosome maturation factor RimM [Chloroflexota bacterium]|nr:ribosome maturation factor RimM [Chloroflexota bacterium]
MAGDEWMLIGRVVGPFGIRGEMKVEPLTDFPQRFRSITEVYVGTARTKREIVSARQHKGLILLRLDGVETPEQVKDLANPEIFVPRAEAAPLPQGHFYLDDALGLDVVTEDGRDVGTVRDVIRTGSNDVFVVRGADGDVLVPVTRNAVVELDFSARRAVIEAWVLGTEE